ncbi:MAG: diacylglycerol kinase family protein [bacterium]|nr:diacylglycerol kinase family protein [bacterium]
MIETVIEDHAPAKHFNSIRFAVAGLIHVFTTQRNFRLQSILGLLTILLALLFDFDRVEWIILLLTIGLVLTAEIANTVLETLVDLSVTRLHPKAKIAKDLAAAAVLIIAVFAAFIGAFLFWPHFWTLLCSL